MNFVSRPADEIRNIGVIVERSPARRRRVWSVIMATCLSCTALSATSQIVWADEECTLVLDVTRKSLLEDTGDCDRRISPASSFKIAIALMGFDSGVLRDAHNPVIDHQESFRAGRPEWRQKTDPTRWLALSVVWYSQQVTRRIGRERFGRYVRAFKYGNMNVAGERGRDGLTRAWLSSSLQITPREQLSFIGRILRRELPVSERAYTLVDETMPKATLPNGFVVRGKTGTAAPRELGKLAWDRSDGWFVGWAVRGARMFAFVRWARDSHEEVEPAGLRQRAFMIRKLADILSDAVIR